jgi:hypothetical protein
LKVMADESPQALEGGNEGSIGGIALGVRPQEIRKPRLRYLAPAQGDEGHKELQGLQGLLLALVGNPQGGAVDDEIEVRYFTPTPLSPHRYET